MPEAVQALLRYGFGELKLEAVWCSHYDWNRQSRRVIEKCGFRYQFTKKTTNVMNATHETVFYALKREEGFPARKKRSLYDRVHHSVSGR